MKINIFFPVVGLLLSSVAFADTRQDLQTAIQSKVDQNLVVQTSKFEHLLAIAGSLKDDLISRKNECNIAYKQWVDIKNLVETSNHLNNNYFKKAETTSRAYADARQKFISAERNILLISSIPFNEHLAYLIEPRAFF